MVMPGQALIAFVSTRDANGVASALVDRRVVARSARLYAGNACDRVDQSLDEDGRFARPVPGQRRLYLQGHHPRAVESQRLRLQPPERPEQNTAAGQEHEREGDFADREE